MNAKEQIIQELKEKILNTIRFGNENYIQQLERLIAATEAAIFDVPSFTETVEGALKESVEIKNTDFKTYYKVGFGDGINFILNYKKPESDGFICNNN